MPHFQTDLEIDKIKKVRNILKNYKTHLEHDYFESEILSSKLEDHFTLKLQAPKEDILKLLDIIPF